MDIPEGVIVPLDGAIAVKIEGKIYVYEDECPHKGCQFSVAGLLEGRTLICTCHWAKFDVVTGAPLTPEITPEPLRPVQRRL